MESSCIEPDSARVSMVSISVAIACEADVRDSVRRLSAGFECERTHDRKEYPKMSKVLNDRARTLEDCMEQIVSSLPLAERECARELISEVRSVGLTSEVKKELLKMLPQQKVEELGKC